MGEDSVERNAAFGLMIQAVPMGLRRRSVAEVLLKFGLDHVASSSAKNLSGGERQRLAMARASATSPMLLLADEPTGNLDADNSRVVVDHLQELNRRGTTIILITHDPEVASAATRQLHLRHGTLHEPQRAPFPEITRDSRPAKRSRKRNPLRTILDTTSDALNAVTSNAGRSLMLILAFALGVGGFISSLGASQSASEQISSQLTAAALDELRVSRTHGRENLTEEPWQDAARDRLLTLPGVRAVGLRADLSPNATRISRFPADSAAESPLDLPVVIADAGLLELSECKIFPASAQKTFASTNGAGAVIGRRAADRAGIVWKATGNTVWIAGKAVPIIGIVETCGRDDALPASVVASSSSVGGMPPEAGLVVRTDPGMPAPLREAIPLALNPGNPASVHVGTVADLRRLTRGIATDLGLLLSTISAILIALSVLSASTSMYLSVKARRQEIALRRSLGASRWAVARVFLTEGALLGLAGGLLGSALGLASVLGICVAQGWAPILDPSWVLIGMATGTAASIFSSILPAFGAARSNPAQAIRG